MSVLEIYINYFMALPFSILLSLQEIIISMHSSEVSSLHVSPQLKTPQSNNLDVLKAISHLTELVVGLKSTVESMDQRLYTLETALLTQNVNVLFVCLCTYTCSLHCSSNQQFMDLTCLLPFTGSHTSHTTVLHAE